MGDGPNGFTSHGQAPPNTARRTRRRADSTLAGGRFQLLSSSAGETQPVFSLSNQTSSGISVQPSLPAQPACRANRSARKWARKPPFAALSLAWLDIFGFNRGGGLRTAISQSWAQIDVDQSGKLSLAELQDYAAKAGLPKEYVQNFMEAVLSADPSRQRDSETQPEDKPTTPPTIPGGACMAALPSPHQPPAFLASLLRWLGPNLEDQGGSAEQAPPPELTFSMFEHFVRSRETALRKAFDMFDRDRDGVISAGDLEASLAHITICCPRSRCVYRCPRTMAHAMLQRTQAAGQSQSSSVDFASFRRFFMLLPQTEMAVEYWLKAGTLPLLTEKLAAVHEGGEPGHKAAAWGHLFAGAVAGAASRTATAPLETLRLAVMTGTLPSGNLVQAASSIVEAHGWRGLYRGNALNVLRSAPQKALDFFAFDAFKRLLAGGKEEVAGGTEGGAGALRTFAAAGLAGATSWALLYPLETVRSRVTAGMAPLGMGIGDVARTIIRAEGVGALYRGLGWSLAGIFPEAALCYGLHDLLKHCYRQSHQGQEPGVLPSLGFGVFSAFTGQLVAFPLETVARRLQVYQGPGGLPTMLNAMLKQGGPMILYRGVGAATLRLIPMAVVSFGTYEVVRSALMALEEGVNEDNAYSEVHNYCTPLSTTLAAGTTSTSSTSTSSSGGTCGPNEPCPLRTCSLLPASGISTHRCSSLELGPKRRPPVGAAVLCGATPNPTAPPTTTSATCTASGEGDVGPCGAPPRGDAGLAGGAGGAAGAGAGLAGKGAPSPEKVIVIGGGDVVVVPQMMCVVTDVPAAPAGAGAGAGGPCGAPACCNGQAASQAAARAAECCAVPVRTQPVGSEKLF